MPIVRFLARALFASIFVDGGVKAARDPGARPARVAQTLHLPEPELMVRANGAAMATLGCALALGFRPRLAAAGLAALMVPTTYVGHQFWAEESDQGRRMQRIHFMKNLGLIGGLLTYAIGED